MAPQSPGFIILSQEPAITADFTLREDVHTPASKLPRFFHTPHGGPKSKAKGKRKASTPSYTNSSQKRKILDTDTELKTPTGEAPDRPDTNPPVNE